MLSKIQTFLLLQFLDSTASFLFFRLSFLLECFLDIFRFSEENCETVLQLFNKYWKLSNVLKGTNSSQGIVSTARAVSLFYFVRSKQLIVEKSQIFLILSRTAGKKVRQSSSKQIARSMLCLRGTANILKAILRLLNKMIVS